MLTTCLQSVRLQSEVVIRLRLLADPQIVRSHATVSSGPINVIVIDTTLSAANLKEQLRAAEQIVDSSGAENRISVYAHPFSSAAIKGQAVYSTKGNTIARANGTESPVPGFQRVTSSSFVKEL